jgi:hypothetical protein
MALIDTADVPQPSRANGRIPCDRLVELSLAAKAAAKRELTGGGVEMNMIAFVLGGHQAIRPCGGVVQAQQTPNHVFLAATLSFVSFLALPLFAQNSDGIGDGAARIKAAVTDEHGQPYRECRIELLNTDDKRVLVYNKESGTFVSILFLSPKPKLYLLRIACEGSDETFTSEPKLFGDSETSYRVPVDLGVIQLKRREHPPNY